MSERKFIAIAGNIGAGKSSLLEFLTGTYHVAPFYEPNDENPYLEDFYGDMKRWAFQSQMFFLSNKFRIHQEADRTPGVVIQDPTTGDYYYIIRDDGTPLATDDGDFLATDTGYEAALATDDGSYLVTDTGDWIALG